VLRCDESVARRVRYVFDSLFLAAGVAVDYVAAAPASGPWLLYATAYESGAAADRALTVAHDAAAWRHFDGQAPATHAESFDGLPLVFAPPADRALRSTDIGFDLAANAFYFLSSWSERCARGPGASSRQLHATSDAVRLGLPQDIVDRYLTRLIEQLRALCARIAAPMWPAPCWPGGRSFALVLSHDVDYLPVRPLDNTVQAAKAVLRHLVRQRDAADAWRAARGWLAALVAGRDPYGCVPEIIARERALGLRSSFQVAVGHRHANDVNYRIEDDRVRDYLRAITDAGFDLCLHGSYRSTEDPRWYVEEAALLGERLARPLGSRQHFLSFDYDNLFSAEEAAGVRYDMSMGYPDHPGPRAGFSYPYFPYNLREDRPYRVLQISLFLMDVTLRSYMALRPGPARSVVDACLADLEAKRGCASVVWHPIVFGGARDPGYDGLYFDMAERVGAMGGLATDGRTIDQFWRNRASRYASFSFA
jgi:hypothetical protein